VSDTGLLLSHVTGARFIEQSLQEAKNQILMLSSDTHMFIDNVQECNYDEFSNDHVVIFIDHFLTMFFAFYIVNISCLNAIFLMSFITPNNKQNETFNMYMVLKTLKVLKFVHLM
jgi:phosphatidylglycerophosphatase A